MPSSSFALGQRWLSTAEQELGLGLVVAMENRRLSLLFPATGESRDYAVDSAPLLRVQFSVGEVATSHAGWQLEIEKVIDKQGLLEYQGKRLDNDQPANLPESQLAHDFQFERPEQRLLAGQVDEPKWFDLRQQCLTHQYQHGKSALRGLLGARVDLIPHQLHIASEVGRRYAPRVLLADEVGLGKTIEAALIIHSQLQTERAERVLIVVPPSLLHQWLVEMLRRVNLHFSLFDEARCQALSEEGSNPFESEQLILCSLDFLTSHPQYQAQAVAAGWDLLVVDEAHHLVWSEQQASAEYLAIEQLAAHTKGVLLLTATPDQLGHESHFARLRLLDPARFHSYQAFVAEQNQFTQLADAVTPLLADKPLTDIQQQAIQAFIPEARCNEIRQDERQQLVSQLLDRHGTGRLLFRNSRAGVSGFKQRFLHDYALPMPASYQRLQDNAHDIESLLFPHLHSSMREQWLTDDPRIDWLLSLLEQLKGQKVLAICRAASTAQQLAELIRSKTGIRCGVFHEGMSIVERDKTAHFFAQQEQGAQILLCSEIGSEGRNFQFAHHLLLFDLPLIPDLLEQRIGRLDRIGQRQDIQIHLPYFANSAQQVLFDWYHQGLDAFCHTCPTGSSLFEALSDELVDAMLAAPDMRPAHALVASTQQKQAVLKAQLEAGRDRLLEINSAGRGRVEPLLDEIRRTDQSEQLVRFSARLFDALGILHEEKDANSYLLTLTESLVHPLPGLSEEGLSITYQREVASQLEHLQFVSWDHPMLQHAMDRLLGDNQGKSALALANNKHKAAGFYWLETLFVLSGKAPRQLQLKRFLPATPIYLCIDALGQCAEITFDSLQSVDQSLTKKLVTALAGQIEQHLANAQAQAQQQAAALRQQALNEMQQNLGEELARLRALQAVNPSIRQDEITHLEQQISQLTQAINQADIQLDAIRLVVNHPS